MGIVCADTGFADRDVTATGDRISPGYVRGHICKFCGSAVDGIIVPLGFSALISGFFWPAFGKILAGALSIVTAGLPR